MDNQAVYLSEREWQAVMGLISLAPWRDANPLLMKIGAQLQQQQAGAMAGPGLQQAPQQAEPAGQGPPRIVNGPNKEVRS